MINPFKFCCLESFLSLEFIVMGSKLLRVKKVAALPALSSKYFSIPATNWRKKGILFKKRTPGILFQNILCKEKRYFSCLISRKSWFIYILLLYIWSARKSLDNYAQNNFVCNWEPEVESASLIPLQQNWFCD